MSENIKHIITSAILAFVCSIVIWVFWGRKECHKFSDYWAAAGILYFIGAFVIFAAMMP